MKLSLVVTVLNEESTVGKLIESIATQTKFPHEVIFVDGGSSDRTTQIILQESKKTPSLKIKLIKKKGNRSVGRNEAIRISKGDVILITDSGCTLDSKWVENISKPFKDKAVDVVAGYYKGTFRNIFEKSLIPYVLVMSDKVNEKEFLPATRSVAFKKSTWLRIGGFDENLAHNEDYAFAVKLKELRYKIKFEKKAVVFWFPRSNLRESFIMFFRFAFGDIQANILRTKVIFIFLRYISAAYLLLLNFIMRSYFLAMLTLLFFASYILWSIYKNYKYVNSYKGFFYLPLLQFTSDIAILMGTTLGVVRAIKFKIIKGLIKKNIILTFTVVAYILTTLSFIKWGIPGNDHPFTYHMDEWHQLQSVRYVFQYGSPNLPGAANGSMLHFFISGILLIPFTLLQIINPFVIKTAVGSLEMQERLFMILRLNTLFFGILSIFVFAKVSKYLNLNVLLSVALFIFTPAWLMLSNHFKYDIALLFWLILSILFIIRYSRFPTFSNYLLVGFFSALALAVKVSAIPIIPIYILSFFFFTPSVNRNYKRILAGITLLIGTFFLFGIPDVLFKGGNMGEYLYSNIIVPAKIANEINIGNSFLSFMVLHQFPTIFGHVFFVISILSILYLCMNVARSLFGKQTTYLKIKLFFLLSLFIFLISFIPLSIQIGANRALVLLPFMIIIIGLSYNEFKRSKSANFKKIIVFMVIFLICIQVIESYSWTILKHSISPQKTSSSWIINNIPEGTTIGVENIPVYQFEPDIILKEYYNLQYLPSYRSKFNYLVIDERTNELPKIIVISNAQLALDHYVKSSKKRLLGRLYEKGYYEIATFSPVLPFYKFFGNQLSYMNSGLLAYPASISIFKKK
mgnify:FL=1